VHLQFHHANFQRARLMGADLTDADFEFANLYKASFVGCTLQNTNFTNAFMPLASLKGVDLRTATFKGADLYPITVEHGSRPTCYSERDRGRSSRIDHLLEFRTVPTPGKLRTLLLPVCTSFGATLDSPPP
jgi:hypothetical protein